MLSRSIQAIARSLVHVSAERDPDEEAMGSGFVVRADGLLLTAYHLVRGAARIRVRGIGWAGDVSASLVARDAQADIAALRIFAADLAPVRFGGGGQVALGSEVAFTGFPYGDIFRPPLAVTARGIVGNRFVSKGVEHLVIDAVCAEGLSGAPLFLTGSGRVVGLVGARFDPERTRARLRGADEDELARLPPSVSAITFAVPEERLAALVAGVR